MRLGNREEIRRNTQKYAEIPYQKPQAIRRNTQAKTPQAKTPSKNPTALGIQRITLF